LITILSYSVITSINVLHSLIEIWCSTRIRGAWCSTLFTSWIFVRLSLWSICFCSILNTSDRWGCGGLPRPARLSSWLLVMAFFISHFSSWGYGDLPRPARVFKLISIETSDWKFRKRIFIFRLLGTVNSSSCFELTIHGPPRSLLSLPESRALLELLRLNY